jgi:hypothetical protein
MTDFTLTELMLGNESESTRLVQVYQCHRKWNELQTTGDDGVRFCDSCQRAVYHVVDFQGIQQTVSQSRCVMLEGKSADDGKQTMVIGEVAPPYNGVTSARPALDEWFVGLYRPSIVKPGSGVMEVRVAGSDYGLSARRLWEFTELRQINVFSQAISARRELNDAAAFIDVV